MDEYYRDQQNLRRPTLSAGEAILWQGKPKKSSFIATRSLTLFPIAAIWFCIDFQFIKVMFQGGPQLAIMIPFMLLHLAPVWAWLGSTLTAGIRWKNTAYYVTNRRIIIQGGLLAVNESSLFYKDIRNAHVHINLLDKIFHTGDIIFDCGNMMYSRKNQVGPMMVDLENPHDVYDRVQRIILDMQTDMEFPNAYRPAENPGYRTNYHQ